MSPHQPDQHRQSELFEGTTAYINVLVSPSWSTSRARTAETSQAAHLEDERVAGLGHRRRRASGQVAHCNYRWSA